MASSEHLIGHYNRSASGWIARGDHIDGMKIAGFTYDSEPATGEPGDRLLLEGDENLERPPERTVPSPGDDTVTIDRFGPSPVASLDAKALACMPELRTGLQCLIAQLNAEFMRPLLAGLLDSGHVIWLVGGAVRELLANGPDAEVDDLDFTGTAGPGELDRIAEDVLRASDGGDHVSYLSPDLVWSLAPEDVGAPWLMEYRPLTLDGFKFAAYGGDLAMDSEARDLTVNALYFDIERAIIADPTGFGRRHVTSSPRVLTVAYQGTDPMGRAGVVLRCMKFMLRWPSADSTGITAWAKSLPDDLADRLSPDGLSKLASLRDYTIPQRHQGHDELQLARRLGPAASGLVERIRQWTARERGTL